MTQRALRKLPRDGWAGLVLLVGSLFFLAHLLATPSEGVTAHVSSNTLPTLLVGVLALLGALMLAAAWREGQQAAPAMPQAAAVAPASAQRQGAGRRVVLLVGATAAYIALLPLLGYYLCTALYFLAMALLFGNRRPLLVLLLTLLVPLALMLFFEKFMIIPLPSASLFG
jgi:hypothetical protein